MQSFDLEFDINVHQEATVALQFSCLEAPASDQCMWNTELLTTESAVAEYELFPGTTLWKICNVWLFTALSLYFAFPPISVG